MININKDWVVIPVEIWTDKNLSIQEKAVLAEILRRDAGDGCRARNQDFSAVLRVGQRRVQAILKGLKDKGYITLEYTYRENTREIDGRILKVVGERYE